MVERVIVWATQIRRQITPSMTSVVPSEIPGTTWRPSRGIFWLVPLETETSNIAPSVVDVFPVKLWDRHSHQFFWIIPPEFQNANPGTRYAPFTAGAARINLSPVIGEEAEHGSKGVGTAVVHFGLRFSKPRAVPATGGRPTYPDFSTNPSWCLLVKDDGISSLDQHYSTPITAQDAQQHSSLALGGGVVLHASTVRTVVTNDLSEYIKIWTTVSDSDPDADVVMSIGTSGGP
jgi:hypothetical protein